MRVVRAVLPWLCAGFAGTLFALCLRVAVVGGGSMEPALTRGDICMAASRVPVRPEDIVLYRSQSGGWVLHRVVRVRPDGSLRTRGDANAHMDRLAVSAADVGGRVVFVLPLGKAVCGWLSAARGATLGNQSQS